MTFEQNRSVLERVPMWHLQYVASSGPVILTFRSFDQADKIAKAYGPDMLPEVTGPHYHLVWKERLTC